MIVTGHKGFVGKAFFDKVKEWDPIGFDLPENDILKINEYSGRDVRTIVHFAAIADLNESIADQDKNFDVNIRGTYEVAKYCVKNKIRLVYISTCCVYGDSGGIEEEDTTIPMTVEPYACSKMAGEYILRGMPGLDYTILRIGTVYGPGMRKELFNCIALEKCMNNEQINVNGLGYQERAYIYIDDLIQGIYGACENFASVYKETINLCGIEKTSVLGTIETAKKLTGNSPKIVTGCNRYGDFIRENISIEKAYRLMGWEPGIDYKTGMARTYQWLKTLDK
jgi:nucleoside-diphosphate-sugar epimerase